ncbi:MAG TPA: NUDIX hydrolase [Pseudonocardia sp.]|nr:NUDIX hydrolase [Pseudonocardia sp.]
MSVWVWVAAVVVALLLVWVAALCAVRIRRLDRLHVRTDAARDGLEAALERRAAATLATADVVAAEPAGPERAGALRAAVAGTRIAGATGAEREAAENVLGRALAAVDRSGLPPAVLEELVDAEQLLILARRVHNDAVRDTRGLRSRRLVRWLHLSGTAPMPEYFEIADPESLFPGAGVTTAAPVRPPVTPPA